MIRNAVLKCVAIAMLTFAVIPSHAGSDPVPTKKNSIPAKPYKVLTSGKRITVQSKTDISKIMVWTSKGQRFVEENNVNAASYSFNVTIREKFLFMMLELSDGKRFTEKIGISE